MEILEAGLPRRTKYGYLVWILERLATRRTMVWIGGAPCHVALHVWRLEGLAPSHYRSTAVGTLLALPPPPNRPLPL